ncbi:hypothetical protein Acr_20g0011620 [Actinidia rufa]|uniref:Uncharacterized protein n=1 Tax=Actinidia rufa TaxID=165716 RepID=A0A7J0GEY5_9ERIC|nr:hypothetical protein Acr_20g0011620 [Actinidia rufa]
MADAKGDIGNIGEGWRMATRRRCHGGLRVRHGSGNVVDAFIPKKRSQRQNTRLGFVRLYSRKEVDQAINYLNGVITRDHKFFCGIREVVRGEKNLNSTSTVTIKARGEGNAWLYRSMVAQLSSLRTLESVVENLNFANRKDVQARHIGGKTVTITFPSTECLEEIEEGKSLEWIKEDDRDWGPKPFEFINAWLSDEMCLPLMEKTWADVQIQGCAGFRMFKKIQAVKSALKSWNKEIFCDLRVKLLEVQKNLSALDLKAEESPRRRVNIWKGNY